MTLMATFWQTIKLWDQTGLFHINQVWSNSLFDAVMPWLRESAFWLPLYLFFLMFMLFNYGVKGLLWILCFVLTITICDQVGGFIKNWIARPRPCNDPFMMAYIHLRLEHCSGAFSFPSNHASNHFGMAMFMHQTIKKTKVLKTSWLFAWAFIVCYAQMYVGVHYPLDILGGTILGLAAGALVSHLFNSRVKLVPAEPVAADATLATKRL